MTKLCFVIAASKVDVLQCYGGPIGQVPIYYAVQSSPGGLCDAILRAVPLVQRHDPVVVGLPDAV